MGGSKKFLVLALVVSSVAVCIFVASSSNPRKQEYRKREGESERGKGG